MSSASEAQYAALLITGKGGLPLRYTLNDINCIQPPTIITTDNSVAKGIATSTCKVRRSKSIDMRYHWLKDRVALKDFDIVWHPGVDSLADFNTKIQLTCKYSRSDIIMSSTQARTSQPLINVVQRHDKRQPSIIKECVVYLMYSYNTNMVLNHITDIVL